MPDIYSVAATMLNVRSAPVINPANVIGHLGQGELINKVGQPSADWFQIQTAKFSGYAAARFLAPVADQMPTPEPTSTAIFIPPRVHFPANRNAAINSTESRYTPLYGFQAGPRPVSQSDTDRCLQLNANIAALDVERSARYLPNAGTTFCNIYAYDVCFLAGVYLPRVWWVGKALLEISRGGDPRVVYGTTVRELNANALFDWLTEWGDEYGWQRCQSLTELQERANHGAVGIICAQRKDLTRSGHITIVAPETPGSLAERVGQTVVKPLQSQAGARNKMYFANQWWIDLAPQFRAFGYWTCA